MSSWILGLGDPLARHRDTGLPLQLFLQKVLWLGPPCPPPPQGWEGSNQVPRGCHQPLSPGHGLTLLPP